MPFLFLVVAAIRSADATTFPRMALTKLQRSPSSGLKQPENSNATPNEIPIIALKHHLARRIIKQKQISRRKMVLPVKVAVRFIAGQTE